MALYLNYLKEWRVKDGTRQVPAVVMDVVVVEKLGEVRPTF